MKKLSFDVKDKNLNRTIVECKERWKLSKLRSPRDLNRTIVECKVLHFVLPIACRVYLNRTIVECKAAERSEQ